MRGAIIDRNGTILVNSTTGADGILTRHYLYPAMSSALGYASIRYGVGGAEAAFNSILRGDNSRKEFMTALSDELLHRTQKGADIRLTFDLSIQQQAVKVMGSHTGSIVVIDVPSGQVLAMVSLPTYDPNTLDTNWETLTKAAGKPFFNRVLQGAYQPGSALQTPLMAAALLANYPLDTRIDQADQSVKVGDVTINCVAKPPTDKLTLTQAYAFGCPYPFAKLVQELGFETIQSGFNTFDLNHPPTLTGYVTAPVNQETNTQTTLFGTDNFTDNALGQGSITVTPLEMAVITAAIFNDGNAPVPYSLLQTRQPNTDTWIDAKTVYSPLPMLTANSARQMQTIMQTTVQIGAAQKAAQSNLIISGHAGIAYVGTTAQSWFIGFVTTGSNQGAAIAIVLEDTSDTDLAAKMGGQVLSTAHNYQMTATPQPKGGA
ncbi:MAG: hypothetical protein GC179_29570 [Anaerolineaceae bacterium]|nr:hypothetical protein [Anaerolineaceae bacterium]